MRCSELALAAGLPLAGTATRADRWLVVEHHGPWGRDPVPDTELPPAGQRRSAGVRRTRDARPPGRDAADVEGRRAFRANTTEEGGELRRIELERLEEIVSVGSRAATVRSSTRRSCSCAPTGGVTRAARGMGCPPSTPSGCMCRTSSSGARRTTGATASRRTCSRCRTAIQLGRVTTW